MISSQSVLVVEDDEAIREILRISLMDEGYDVTVAANGEQALQYLKDRTPDLIILDVMMPIMDGEAFRGQQRQLNLAPSAPLIVLSASRTAQPQAEALGADFSMAKPFELDDLLALVRRALERQPVPSYMA